MIQYVIPENCDDRLLVQATKLLKEGKVLVIQSDSSWIYICDILQKKAIGKIYRIKGDDNLLSYQILCSTLKMTNEVVMITNQTFRVMKKKLPGPYIFILPARKSTARCLKASKLDHGIGVRIIPSEWINRLIEEVGNPLLSGDVDHSNLGVESQNEVYSYLIEESLSHEIPLILDAGMEEFSGESTILNFAEEESDILVRQGIGIWP